MEVSYTLGRQDLRRCTFYVMCGRQSSVVEILALFGCCALLAGWLVNIVTPVYVGYPLLIAFVLAVLMYPLILHLSHLLLTQLIVCATLGHDEFRPHQVTLGADGVRLTQRGREKLTDWEHIVWVERNGHDIYFHRKRGTFFVPCTAFTTHEQAELFLESVSAFKQMRDIPGAVWPPPPKSASRRIGG